LYSTSYFVIEFIVFFDISDSNAPAPNPNAAAARFAAMEQRMKERNSETCDKENSIDIKCSLLSLIGRKDQASSAATKFNSEFNALHRGCKAHLLVDDSTNDDNNNVPMSRDELQERASDVAANVQKMRDLLAANAAALSSFDASKANKTIEECETALATFKATHLPKKAFGFRSTVVAPVTSSNAATSTTTTNVASTSTPSGADTDSASSRTVVADRENCVIVLRQADVNNDVTLKNLNGCRVWIDANTSALRCDSLRNCTVMVGNVGGSMWVKRSTDCTFVGVAQQVRIGESHTSLFQMRTRSRICIEQSDSLRFAPLCAVDGCESARLTSDDNSDEVDSVWSQVQDFDWIKPTTASPNWSLAGAADTGVLTRLSRPE
jgi:hypothetical protein